MCVNFKKEFKRLKKYADVLTSRKYGKVCKMLHNFQNCSKVCLCTDKLSLKKIFKGIFLPLSSLKYIFLVSVKKTHKKYDLVWM